MASSPSPGYSITLRVAVSSTRRLDHGPGVGGAPRPVPR